MTYKPDSTAEDGDGPRQVLTDKVRALGDRLADSWYLTRYRGRGQHLKFSKRKVIIRDESTMAHKRGLEALDDTLRDLRGNRQHSFYCLVTFVKLCQVFHVQHRLMNLMHVFPQIISFMAK
ncbi:hypothetical protein AAG570_000055 [Ranatra chinensis]|uniref:Uncharacterized protein n=1 Tax=Ranatra chinensis TaxID=642074 RepID=A0ABD0ZH52_9HEMI